VPSRNRDQEDIEMHNLPRFALIALLLASVHGASAADDSSATTQRAARQRVTFTESNPLAGLEEYCRRLRQSPALYRREGTDYEYTLADESFELVVPSACSADDPHGLLVWISPGRADLPREWLDVCAKHKLIWISANNSGNNRHPIARIGLALDAVRNMKAKYPLDPKRIYVAGFSGGGRVSSMTILTYPDVFTGAICMMGSNFYRQLPAGEGKAYRATAGRPIEPLFAQAKRLPICLFTGERDPNQPQTKANFEGFKHDRFQHVTYIEVPGVGHNMPGAEWFAKALDDVDGVASHATDPTTRPTTRRAPARSK
jgi:predicted esterase